jgi:DNA polymerase V
MRVKKAGVDTFGLAPRGIVQQNLFDTVDRDGQSRLQGALDGLEKRWGKDSVQLAIQGTHPGWSTRKEHLSRRYTTVWSELLEIDMDRPLQRRS